MDSDPFRHTDRIAERNGICHCDVDVDCITTTVQHRTSHRDRLPHLLSYADGDKAIHQHRNTHTDRNQFRNADTSADAHCDTHRISYRDAYGNFDADDHAVCHDHRDEDADDNHRHSRITDRDRDPLVTNTNSRSDRFGDRNHCDMDAYTLNDGTSDSHHDAHRHCAADKYGDVNADTYPAATPHSNASPDVVAYRHGPRISHCHEDAKRNAASGCHGYKGEPVTQNGHSHANIACNGHGHPGLDADSDSHGDLDHRGRGDKNTDGNHYGNS